MGTVNESTIRVRLEVADDGTLKASLEGTSQSLGHVADAQQAQAESATAAATAQQANAAALTETAESAEAAGARIKAMVANSLAQQAQLAESARSQFERAFGPSTEEIEARVAAGAAASEEAMRRAVGLGNTAGATSALAAQREELAQLVGQIDPTVAALGKLDAQEAALARFHAQGLLDAGEFIALNATIDQSRQRIVGAGEAMESFSLNTAQSRRELGYLVKDISTGQWGRLEQSGLTLASNTGLMAKAFSGAGLAIGSTVGVLGLFVAAAIEGYLQDQRLNTALIATGNYAGTSTEQLDAMARSIAGGTTTIGAARTAVAALADSGRFTASQIQLLAQATEDGGLLMGRSVQQMVAEFTRLQESPVQASAALNQQYHYLTVSVLQQIDALQKQGNTSDAANLALKSYADALRSRAAEAEQQLGTLQKTWDSLKSSASFAWDAMLGIGRPTTDLGRMQSQYDDLYKQITAVQTIASGKKPGFIEDQYLPASVAQGAGGNWGFLSAAPTDDAINRAKALLPVLEQQAQALRQAMAPLQQQASADAGAKAVSASVQQDGTDAIQTLDKLGISLDGVLTKQQKVNQAAEALYKIHLAGGKLPAGVDFNGAQADMPEGAGWDRIKNQLLNGNRKSPEIAAYQTFSNYVQGLDVPNITADSSALTAYEQGIGKLADQMQRYMEKGGDATKAAALFNQGQQALMQTLQRKNQQETDAEASYAAALDKANAALQAQFDNEAARAGMGDREFQQSQQITKAYQDQAEALRQLALQRQKGINGESGGISESQYNADVQAQQRATAQRVAIINQGYQEIDASQESWENGAIHALQNVHDNGLNIAQGMSDAITGAFDDMTSAVVNFEQTGKFSLENFAEDFSTAILKIELRTLEAESASGLLNALFGGAGGASNSIFAGSMNGYSGLNTGAFGGSFDFTAASGGSYVLGGPIHGPGTGTSDSVTIRASRGEYMQTADAHEYYGTAFMDAVRAKRLPRFATGGAIGDTYGAATAGGGAPIINVQNYGNDKVQADSQQMPDGRWLTNIIIGAVTNDLARGGATTKVLEQRYPLQRRGVRVGSP